MAKEKRSLFQKIFKTNKNVIFGNRMKMLNGYDAVFTSFDGNLYNHPKTRACIDTIARHGAKLNPKHIRTTNNQMAILDYNISKIISRQPNTMMNAYDFYYKVISLLYTDNNVFIYIDRDKDTKTPIGLYPVSATMTEIMEFENELYVQFKFTSGNTYTAAYSDVIHLRRFYCKNDVLGGNSKPLTESIETSHTIREGITNAIKTTAGIKGVLKMKMAMLKDEDIIKKRNDFVNDFVSENSNGIAALDTSTDFTAVDIKPQTATDKQLDDINSEILEYFGISEEILKSSYSEDQWNAFYESILEPLSITLSLEFTNKLFTPGQIGFGNEIRFEANRIQYASNNTKINIARYLNNYFTQNEIREIFNMAPVPDGDKFLQDLNHINGNIADQYQGGGDTNGK